MTAKKTAAKKAAAKPEPVEEVSEAAAPEMEGEAYQVGYVGVSSDDEDHSVAGQVAKLSEA
jgi:hypothetical protein